MLQLTMGTMELAANRDYLVGIGPFVIGIFVVLILVGAVALGLRVRAKEPAPPQEPQKRGGAWETHNEHETGSAPANHGPGHQDLARPRTDVHEARDPNDVPHNGVRHMPYEFGTQTRRHEAGEDEQADPDHPEPRTWDTGGSGHGTG
ncbi:DUF6479 family protein [Streptomyces pathocidini]|uniref:DUF6479 family protein n=1 Tax=Streptomyces pathocidini TaxID=1650571 RepID=A0ABW7V249_9ACTN